MSGRKGITWHRFREREIAAEWSGFSETPRSENAREITEALLDAFSYDRPPRAGWTRSTASTPSSCPCSPSGRSCAGSSRSRSRRRTEPPPAGAFPLYEFEPSPPDVLDALLPWYVESRHLPRAAGGRRLGDRGAGGGP